jgi:ATP-dependent Clp protease ATP-binding subunit ClpC
VERAVAIAAERKARPSTLHLLAALLETTMTQGRVLRARGVRPQDLSTAARVHPEPDGVFERIRQRAHKSAQGRSPEVLPAHLLAAAVQDPESALAAWLADLGADLAAVTRELLVAPLDDRSPDAKPTVKPRPAPGTVPVPPARSLLPVGRLSAVDARALQARGALGAAATVAVPAHAHAPTSTPSQEPRTVPGSQRAPVGKSSPRAAKASVGRLDPGSFPVLHGALQALRDEALTGFQGRVRELSRVRDALGRRDGRGALLVGVPGVGKSTLLRALAETDDLTVVALRYAELLASLRGGPERARALVDELTRARSIPGVVLALDPLAPWLVQRELPEEVALELRAALQGGKLAWVGTATAEEARRLSELEPWLDRGALRVDLEALPAEEVRAAVEAHARALEAHHGVTLPSGEAVRAWQLSDRYLGGRAQPDRALQVLDLALSRAARGQKRTLEGGTVAQVVAEQAGLSVERVAATDQERLRRLEEHLAARVVGHREALARIARVVRRNAVGFRGARPLGTFLFLGPTGVGKTETAKALAEVLFPGQGAVTRLDMAEFSEGHQVARLVGAPPGYVGHSDGGQLTEAVRRRPWQLLLLDEMEKAHRDVHNALLGLLDEGRLTDGRGRTVDFCNTLVVMTSNLGSELYQTAARGSVGFHPTATDSVPSLEARVLERARGALPLEFWNRIDEVMVFGSLSRDEVTEVARRLLREVSQRLEASQGIVVEFSPAVYRLLLDEGGYEPALGARPMRRTVARVVEASLADAVLSGELRRGDRVLAEVRGRELTWDRLESLRRAL